MSNLSLYYDTYPCTSDIECPQELVLLHGWGLHSLVWDEVMPGLLEQFQVTVIDLPGLGRSPMPGGDYNLDYLVEHVLKIAPEKAIWVGWSLGGLIASKIAIQYPDKVAALITVASTPCFTANEQWLAAMNADILQGFMDIFAEDWEGTLIRFLALQCKGSATLKSDIRQLKEMLYFHGIPAQKALRCGLEILKDTNLVDDLASIHCPTLHVFGESDHIVPVGVSRSIKSVQPDCETSVIKGVSHVPFISAPELFLQAVYDFMKDKQLVG